MADESAANYFGTETFENDHSFPCYLLTERLQFALLGLALEDHLERSIDAEHGCLFVNESTGSYYAVITSAELATSLFQGTIQGYPYKSLND